MRGFLCWACSYRALTICFKSAAVSGFLRSSRIFAYLPFGGWNECPNTPELMAVAKYWFEQYGAVPAVMTHDELEFLLPVPVSEKEAVDVAVELYGFCPDVIDQGPEEATVGALADVLRQSTVWYFWWD